MMNCLCFISSEKDPGSSAKRSECGPFLKFIYEKYPPKHKSDAKLAEFDCDDDKELKKVFQKASIHYHPDKIDVEEHGKKYKVLCEEIGKCVNRMYERFKLG